MLTNDVLRRVRYAFNLKDEQVLELIALGEGSCTAEELAVFYLKEEEEGFVEMPDATLEAFLDGLIVMKRGPRDPSKPAPPKTKHLNNNLILRKLKIALNHKDVDIISTLKEAGFKASKSEVNALFQRPKHHNYQECGNQFLRNYLQGISQATRRGIANYRKKKENS